MYYEAIYVLRIHIIEFTTWDSVAGLGEPINLPENISGRS